MIMRVLFLFSTSEINNSIIFSPVLRSRLPVGSSAKIIFASLASALAIAVLCFSPPERVAGKASLLFSRPTLFIKFFISSSNNFLF
jgi:hypothetical protein